MFTSFEHNYNRKYRLEKKQLKSINSYLKFLFKIKYIDS